MKRFLCLLAVVYAALLLIFLAVRPTVAQTPDQESQPGDKPNSTPQPDEAEVDWANIQMDNHGLFPHAGETGPGTPEAPGSADPTVAVPDEGTAPPAETGGGTPAPVQITHVIQRGDTLYEIAQRFGVSVAELISANNIQNPQRLQIGHTLIIPRPASAAPDAVVPSQDGGDSYVVQHGDVPYEIAQRFGVSVDALLAANQIADPRRLIVGEILIIPQDGVVPVAETTPVAVPLAVAPAAPGSAGSYVVRRGDTLSNIARDFGITIQALIEANSLANPNRIMTGQTLTIPDATAKSAPEVTPEPQQEISPAPSPTQPPAEEPAQPPPAEGLFIWPVPLQDGWIAQWYRYGHPGIDIILPVGTPIQAAAAGTVEFSGWNNYGFGNLVVLDHGNGYRTLYAHQSERLVSSGDTVAQGDIIGLVGNTGYSTHPHLHFEIRQGHSPVNPCSHLPGGCQ